MAISNIDDHLRNHGFILTGRGWELSPVYDVNPTPYGEELSLNVNLDDSTISIPLAIASAHYYGIAPAEATELADNIIKTVKENWEKLAIKHGLSRGSIEYMRPAFTACYISE